MKISAAFSVLSEAVPYSYFTEPYGAVDGRESSRRLRLRRIQSLTRQISRSLHPAALVRCRLRPSPQSHLTSISSPPAKQGVGNWLRRGRALQSASMPLFSTTGLHSLLSKGGRVSSGVEAGTPIFPHCECRLKVCQQMSNGRHAMVPPGPCKASRDMSMKSNTAYCELPVHHAFCALRNFEDPRASTLSPEHAASQATSRDTIVVYCPAG